MKVGYLLEEELEAAAAATLDSYERRFGEVVAPPVPVEEILECDLGLDFGIEDLRADFGDDALGALWVGERRVRVDASLDPTLFPEKEGRYRFTVGHEIGHWQLHRHLFVADANQGSLFDGPSEPSVVCRTGFRKPPIEWQADAFSARLLMPADMLTRAWAEAGAGCVASSRAARRHGSTSFAAVRQMARAFEVSAQAMRIRLIALGLIPNHAGDSLFGPVTGLLPPGATLPYTLDACKSGDPDTTAQRLTRHHSVVALSLLSELALEHDPVAAKTALRTATGPQRQSRTFATLEASTR